MIIRFLFIFRRRWPIIVFIPLLGAALGIAFTPTGKARSEASYQSTVSVAVDPEVLNQTAISQDLIEAERGEVIATTKGLLEDEAVTAAQIRKVVSTDFDEDSFVVSISARSPDKAEATRYAKDFASAFVSVNNGRADTAEVESLADASEARDAARSAVLEFLSQNDLALSGPNPPASLQLQLQLLQSTLTNAETEFNRVQALPKASEPYRSIGQSDASLVASEKLELPASRVLRMSLGFILGCIGAAVLVAIVERLNPRIDNPDQAAELIGAPVLAMVPVVGRRHKGDLLRADPAEFRGPFAEAFRSMRAHLDFRMRSDGHEKPPRIMVTSATPSEGKSTSAAFMAVSFAEVDRPPVVVGADLRRPYIHKIFGIDRLPGLSSRAAMGGTAVPLAEIVKTDEVTGVSVVPSGPAVDRVANLLGDLNAITTAGQQAGRVVIVDTPPVMVANDATDFLAATDWVVVVVRVGRSTERSIKQMMATLSLNQALVVGVVMVGSVEASDAKRYYYSYYALDEGGETREKVARIPDSHGPVGTTGSIPEQPDAEVPEPPEV